MENESLIIDGSGVKKMVDFLYLMYVFVGKMILMPLSMVGMTFSIGIV